MQQHLLILCGVGVAAADGTLARGGERRRVADEPLHDLGAIAPEGAGPLEGRLASASGCDHVDLLLGEPPCRRVVGQPGAGQPRLLAPQRHQTEDEHDEQRDLKGQVESEEVAEHGRAVPERVQQHGSAEPEQPRAEGRSRAGTPARGQAQREAGDTREHHVRER